MSDIVVSSTGNAAGLHRQHLLSSIQSLDLRFFINTEHQGPIRWVHVQTYHIADLGNELWIRGELERPFAVRLKAESTPDPPD